MTNPNPAEPLVKAAAEASSFVTGIEQLMSIVITDERASTEAARIIHQLADQRDKFKKKRDEGMRFIKEIQKWADSVFPLSSIKTIDRVIDHLKQAIQQFINSQRVVQAAALSEVRSHAELQQAAHALAPAVPQGLTEVEHWTWQVVAEDQLPRDYWIVDKERLDREAAHLKGALKVPGVIPVRTTTLRRSSR